MRRWRGWYLVRTSDGSRGVCVLGGIKTSAGIAPWEIEQGYITYPGSVWMVKARRIDRKVLFLQGAAHF